MGGLCLRRTHLVGMAIRRHGDFDEDVRRLQVFGHVDGVDLVRLVELHHLDGFHLVRELLDAHFGCWMDEDRPVVFGLKQI